MPLAHLKDGSASLTHDVFEDSEYRSTEHIAIAVKFHDGKHLIEDILLDKCLINVAGKSRENGGRFLKELNELEEFVSEAAMGPLVLCIHNLIILPLNLVARYVGYGHPYELEQCALRYFLEHVLVLAAREGTARLLIQES